MTYILETYGCQMNKAESSAMEACLRGRGWTPTPEGEVPDLVLINTCSVRATAETRAWGRIDHHAAAKRSVPYTLVLTGCMAERLRESGEDIRARGIDHLMGTFQKSSFGTILEALESGRSPNTLAETPSFVFAPSHADPGAFRAFVPIMHGCDNFCTYCIVPYLRGRETSRDPGDILSELDALEESGVREVTLLGQNVNSYRHQMHDRTLGFPGLLRLVAAHLRERGRGSIRWIRFLTSHPKDFPDELVEVLASEPLLCRHVHLCVQSGSDRILAAMNRGYSREDYLGLVDTLRSRVPGLSLSTDILVGFPGETEADLEDTLDLMRHAGYGYSFMYHFNPRAGTPAATMPDQLSSATRKERLSRVIALQKELSARSMSERVGCVDEVLVESVSRRKKTEVLGRTQRDEMVVFPGTADLTGTFQRVRLVSLAGNTFRAEIERAREG